MSKTPRRIGQTEGRLGSLKQEPDTVAPAATRRALTSLNSSDPTSTSRRGFKFTPNVNVQRRVKDESTQPQSSQTASDSMPTAVALLKTAHMKSIQLQNHAEKDQTFRRRRAHANVPVPVQANKYFRRKIRREGDVMDLGDIAWTNDGYVPTSLPFVIRETNELKDDVKTEDGKKAKRPKIALMDESSRKAAVLLESNEPGERERNMILLQMPAELPQLQKLVQGDEGGGDYTSSSIWNLPKGHIGKLQVHKSGQVRLVLGGVSFRVDQGVEVQFSQKAAAVVNEEELVMLGPISKKGVVTPDVITLTDSLKRVGVGGEEEDLAEEEYATRELDKLNPKY